jgi:predicted metalloendopeptidase
MTARFTLFATLIVLLTALPHAQNSALKSGIDPANFDKSVRPQDDLFRYVNGTWLAKTELPADRAIYGTFVQLSDKAEADLYALIEELGGDKNKKPAAPRSRSATSTRASSTKRTSTAAGRRRSAPRRDRRDHDDHRDGGRCGQAVDAGPAGPVGGFIDADAGDPTKVALHSARAARRCPIATTT